MPTSLNELKAAAEALLIPPTRPNSKIKRYAHPERADHTHELDEDGLSTMYTRALGAQAATPRRVIATQGR